MLTTEQALAYKIPEEYSPLIFMAQWSGNDEDYYSYVNIDGYGAEFTFTDFYWENDQKVENDIQTYGWGNRLKKNGESIAVQTQDYFAFKTEPSREDATFEGWAEFKVVTNVDEEGNFYDTFEAVSDTIYTTAQMLDKPVPDYNVMYVAKWSDIALDDYFRSDENIEGKINVIFNSKGGTLKVTRDGQQEGPYESWGSMFEAGSTVSESVSIDEVTYWAADRALEGWLVGYDGIITDEEGNTYNSFVQLPDTGLLTTEQALAYKIPEEYSPLIFMAQWSGNDEDYYSDVNIDGYGAEFTFTDYYWENGQKVENDIQTYGWGNRLKKNGESIVVQTQDYFAFKTEPSREDATFEGWVEFKVVTNVDEEGNFYDTFEAVSDTIYTTAQMLDKPVPDYNVMYVAKWSDIALDDYFRSDENIEGKSFILYANGGEILLKVAEPGDIEDALADCIEFVCESDETLADEWQECGLEYVSVEKADNTLKGWKIYTFENAEWYELPVGQEINIGDPDIRIEYVGVVTDENGSEFDRYLIMEFCEEQSQLLSTEELFELKGGCGYYAVAVWEEVKANTFQDVSEDSWQYNFVKFAVDNGLMSGKGKDEAGNIIFDPNNNMTRAEFVQTLYNKEGKPPVTYTDKFSDVPDKKWYTNAIMWAAENNIVSGKGDIFDVNGMITRQEMATILYKYATNYKGYETAGRAEFDGYTDASSISSWATENMKWALNYGIMKGKGDCIAPLENATRAECATMLKNFMDAYE